MRILVLVFRATSTPISRVVALVYFPTKNVNTLSLTKEATGQISFSVCAVPSKIPTLITKIFYLLLPSMYWESITSLQAANSIARFLFWVPETELRAVCWPGRCCAAGYVPGPYSSYCKTKMPYQPKLNTERAGHTPPASTLQQGRLSTGSQLTARLRAPLPPPATAARPSWINAKPHVLHAYKR